MWDFSGDEWIAFLIAAAGTIIGARFYYRPLLSVPLLGRSLWRRLAMVICPPLALLPAYLFIQNCSDPRVGGHLD